MKSLKLKTSIFLFTGLFLFMGLYFVSCLDEGNNTIVLPNEKFVDIKNPRALQSALQVSQGNLVNGNLPQSTPGNNTLSTSINDVKVNSGGNLTLPLIYTGSSTIDKVYFQVIGADGSYYSVTPTLVQGAGGYAYITITMPGNIDDGNFNIQYVIEDTNGNISNPVNTIVRITNDVVFACGPASNTTGSSGLTFTSLFLGIESGPVNIYYDMYGLPDRMDIYQGETWIAGTGSNPNSPIPPLGNCSNPLNGFVQYSGNVNFNYDSSKGQIITVVISGCLGSGTSWEWRVVSAPFCE